MGWEDYYSLLEKYGGNLKKAAPSEMKVAADNSPENPLQALADARTRWEEDNKAKAKKLKQPKD